MDIDKVLEAYDDDAAIEFIKNELPENVKSEFSDDDLQYFLDVMYILDEKCVIDPDEFKKKLLSEAAKDGITSITADNVDYLIDGEAAYFKSISQE